MHFSTMLFFGGGGGERWGMGLDEMNNAFSLDFAIGGCLL